MILQVFFRIFFLSFVFTSFLFAYERVFLRQDISLEEEHIEPTHSSAIIEESTTEQNEELPENIEIQEGESFSGNTSLSQEIEQTSSSLLPEKKNQDISFTYIPQDFQTDIVDYTRLSRSFLDAGSIEAKIQALNVEFYKVLVDVRGKMKQKTLKIWGVSNLSQEEFLAVFIHEFSHYLDVYFFSDGVFGDVSQRFYDISWESTKIVKKGQETKDFVSGYATTNKYEDFAESLTYYILHNRDFATKATKSQVLKMKYDFFANDLFLKGEFQGTDFSQNNIIKDYYWDITKIGFDRENFLQYLRNEI